MFKIIVDKKINVMNLSNSNKIMYFFASLKNGTFSRIFITPLKDWKPLSVVLEMYLKEKIIHVPWESSLMKKSETESYCIVQNVALIIIYSFLCTKMPIFYIS